MEFHVMLISDRKYEYGHRHVLVDELTVWNQRNLHVTGFPLDLENLENLEKWEYTWKTWKYQGILKNLINIMEKWQETWKNLVATKNSSLTPLKQYRIL